MHNMGQKWPDWVLKLIWSNSIPGIPLINLQLTKHYRFGPQTQLKLNQKWKLFSSLLLLYLIEINN